MGTQVVSIVVLLAGLLWPAFPAQHQQANPRAKIVSPHGTLNLACENCHTYTSWRPLRAIPEFNHDKTAYPLRGMHVNVSCKQCHISLVFTNVGSKCADCHADIHRRQFGANCESCHTVKGWKVGLQAIRDHQNRFPLIGAHALAQCEECHMGAASGQFKGLSTDCYSCHSKQYATPVLDHRALSFPLTCNNCHSMDSWLGAKFDHLKFTGFALTGMHSRLDCASCHLHGQFKGTPANCFACHSKEYNATSNPNHVQAGFPQDCGMCHSTTNWLNATFDHSKTKFPLTGGHTSVKCESCHVGGNFKKLPTNCSGCHLPQFKATSNPNHVQAAFSTDCTICHTTANWTNATFDHSKYTKFPLTGLHAKLTCTNCHVGGKYTGTPATCSGCHMTDFAKTTNPNHVAEGYPTSCQVCHSTNGWKPSTFDHSKTIFPLTGGHTALKCSSCHVAGKFTGLPTDCAGCHLALFKSTTNPGHVAAGFPTDCTICHSTANWTSGSFDHAKYTKFPLTGLHANLKCTDCHVGGKYTGTPATCVGCHLPDFNKTTNPNHVAQGFPTSCQMCHSTSGWKPSSFDHSKGTFPLTGAHSSVTCASCHVGGNYTSLPTACSGCHIALFKATKDPNHVTLGWPTDCTICHTTSTWGNASFDHAKYTKYPLSGKHVTVACLSCHVGGKYAGTPADCGSCHIKDYNATTNPNHKTLGFPTDCSICHATAGWTPATFDHSKTKFPLTGFHTKVTCVSCHKNGVYAGLPTACASCHIADFNGTTNPNHKTSGFPTTCEVCHSTTAWSPASFDHSKTGFPLTGDHLKLTCDTCHKGKYDGTLPKDCYSCHKTDYVGTTNPNHVAAMFPTTCSTCHNTATWLGAVFNHTWFPIYSGNHAGKWTSCADCHTNSANYAVFSCITCHQHSQANTDPHHTDVRGYSYGPTTCYTCHANGSGGG